MGSLYQDPMFGKDIVHRGTHIGLTMKPTTYSLKDPVMLRHALCLMIVIRNSLYIYLCWRHLRLCKRKTEPPPEMSEVMPEKLFLETRNEECRATELNLVSYVLDAIFSCCELYFSIFDHLWHTTNRWYKSTAGVTWNNLAFMILLAAYLTLRKLPTILYNKLILERRYEKDPLETTPLVGLLCALVFLIVMTQVVLIPMTEIILFIDKYGGQWFVLWIWAFLFAVSVIVVAGFTIIGAPCMGKLVALPEGNLKTQLEAVLKIFRFPINRVYIMNTFYTMKATAYGWNCCCSKRLIILDNLLWNQGKSDEELEEYERGRGLSDNLVAAFMVHQLSHFRYFHFTKSFVMMHMSLLFYLLIFGTCYRQITIYEAAGFSRILYPRSVGYWLVYKYVMPPYLTISTWVLFYFLRRFEYAADQYAFKLGYGEPLSEALLKLFADNMEFPYADHWYLMWHRWKPSCWQRLANLEELKRPGSIPHSQLI